MVSIIANEKTKGSMPNGNINMSYEENKPNPDNSNSMNKFAKLAQIVLKQEYSIKYLKNVARMYEGR